MRRAEGHTEALAPQDYTAERVRVGVGVVGHGVTGVTSVGTQATEVYVSAVCKLSPRETRMVDGCVAEPYAQSGSKSGVQILQPQNLCPVSQDYEARNTTGSMDATGKFSTAGGLHSRRQTFIGGDPDQQLPRLQPPQGHRHSDDGNR
nr:hypothetical protein [Mycobacterium sp. E3251]